LQDLIMNGQLEGRSTLVPATVASAMRLQGRYASEGANVVLGDINLVVCDRTPAGAGRNSVQTTRE
jgi:hypothetical protein